MALTSVGTKPSSLAAQQRQKSREALLAEQQRITTPISNQPIAGNPIGLISSGLQGISQRADIISNRPAEQANLDSANAIRQEALKYQRDQDTIKNTLNVRRLDQAADQFQRQFDAGRADAAATQAFREKQLAQSRPSNAYQIVATNAGNFRLNRQTGEYEPINLSPTGQPIDATEAINPNTNLPARFTKDMVEAARNAAANFDSAQGTLNLIDSFTADDFRAVGGKSSYLPTFVTGAATGESKFAELSGKGFLENVASFEGKGALSDAEGRAIRAAYSGIFDSEGGMKKGVPEEQVFNQVQNIKQNLQIASRKAQFIEAEGRQPTIKESRELSAEVRAANPTQSWSDFKDAGTRGNQQSADILRREAGLNVGQSQQQAPQAALDYLNQNPNAAAQFRAKYGYLPEGY